MKPVADVQAETAEILGKTVAEVTSRAIEPALGPFKQKLERLTEELENRVDDVNAALAVERKELEKLTGSVTAAVELAEHYRAGLARAVVEIEGLRVDIARLADRVATLRQQEHTIRALSAVRSLLVVTVVLAGLAVALAAGMAGAWLIRAGG